MSTNWWKIKDIARQIWDKKIEGDNDDGVEEEKDASGSKHTKYTLGMMLSMDTGRKSKLLKLKFNDFFENENNIENGYNSCV